MDHYLKGCIEKTEQIKDLSNKTFEYSLVYEQDFSLQLEKISSQELFDYFQDNLEYLELEGFHLQRDSCSCWIFIKTRSIKNSFSKRKETRYPTC